MQGWKLYISASNANFAATLDLVRPILAAHDVGFKHIASQRGLIKINSGLYGYSQVGKTIVAYFDDDAHVVPVVTDLKGALRHFAGTTTLPPFASAVGGGLPLSYRYGSFTGDKILIDGAEVPDDRARPVHGIVGLPVDPFLAVLEAKEKDGLDSLLLSYPVYEVLSQSAKGGVYAALDLGATSFSEVVLKVGRRHGNVLPDGRDGMDLVRREGWFFKLAVECSLEDCLPRFDGLVELPDAAVIVMERIEGESLQELHRRDKLTVEVLERALTVLRRFHDAGLVVGDAKLANFMLSSAEEIKAIDFESGGLIIELSVPDQHCTFLFTDTRLQQRPRELETMHFLYSVLHTDEGESFDETRRIIDLDVALMCTKEQPPLAMVALDMMRTIVAGL